jgi:hypothetical protein
VYNFKCSSNLTLFVPLITTSQSSLIEISYKDYSNAISSIIASQLPSFTQADRSTLCLDPPFQKSIQYLHEKHQALLANLPIFTVYYQYCGFAKTFRVFFIDDSSLPNIAIY